MPKLLKALITFRKLIDQLIRLLTALRAFVRLARLVSELLAGWFG